MVLIVFEDNCHTGCTWGHSWQSSSCRHTCPASVKNLIHLWPQETSWHLPDPHESILGIKTNPKSSSHTLCESWKGGAPGLPCPGSCGQAVSTHTPGLFLFLEQATPLWSPFAPTFLEDLVLTPPAEGPSWTSLPTAASSGDPNNIPVTPGA